MDEKEEWSARDKLFTPEIKKLRLQIKACENIRNRSFDKKNEKIETQIDSLESKEAKKDVTVEEKTETTIKKRKYTRKNGE